MATRKLLHESGSVAFASEGPNWLATLVTPGQGSSGFYSEAMLTRDAATTFPAGTKLFFKHPEKDGVQRDPRDQWGYMGEAASFTPGVGVQGKISVLEHWKPVVNALGDAGQAALSIYAMGESDEEGNVTQLLPDEQNSVDMVAYPGRPGSGLTEKMFESARAAAPKTPDTASAQVHQKEEGNMDEVKALLEAFIAKFDTFVTESKAANLTAAVAEADADVIEKAVEEGVSAYDEKVKAIDAAEDLLPSQVESLRKAAKAGKDIAPLIEDAKKFVAEAKTALTEGDSYGRGRVVEGAGNDDDNTYQIGRYHS